MVIPTLRCGLGRSLPLMTAVTLAACAVAPPASTSGHAKVTPTASAAVASPRIAQTTAPLASPLSTGLTTGLTGAATLTGKVKLYVDTVSTSADAIISNHGGGLVRDHGGGLISNNGGSIVANNGGGLVSTTRLKVLASSTRHEAYLADAVITVEDAAGKPVLDAAGKPMSVATDSAGNYTLTGNLPEHGIVLRVKLWNGGELVALAPHAATTGREQPIDTSTTLGGDYVLDQYVKGDQQKLDKLPLAEADKLHGDLDAVSPLIAAVPAYNVPEAVKLTDGLRAQAPAVDRSLIEIHDLLLGQLRNGDGRQGTAIATYGPTALVVDASGNLIFGEPQFGRLREVASDGTVSTLSDAVRGKFSKNFPGVVDAAEAKDGSLYLLASGQVQHLKNDGSVEVLAGTSTLLEGVSSTTPNPDIRAARIALGPDGTLYIGEAPDGVDKSATRVIALAPNGTRSTIAIDATWTDTNWVRGLACGPDGTLYVTARMAEPKAGKLYKRTPDGKVVVVASDLNLSDAQDFTRLAPDGTLYVAEMAGGRISAIAPDGTHRIVAGKGGPAVTSDLVWPGSMAVSKEGTLFVADANRNTISTLATDGSWRVVVGTPPGAPTDPANLALDAPTGAAYDDQGRLLVVERGGHVVVRFDGKGVTTVAGTGHAGDSADGGPATTTALAFPFGLAYGAGNIYVGESGTHRLRKIAADGTVSTVVSGTSYAKLGKLLPIKATDRPLTTDFSTAPETIAVAPDGRIYWSDRALHQVYRTTTDGHVELVAGRPPANAVEGGTIQLGAEQEATGPATEALLGSPSSLAFDAKGDLYIADSGSFLIRKVTGLDGATPTISRYAGTASFDVISQPETSDKGFTSGLQGPCGLAIAKDGTMYVSEIGTKAMPLLVQTNDGAIGSVFAALPASYARIRKITPDGHMTVIAGPGTKHFPDPHSADGLVLPQVLTLGPDGSLAIVDGAANLVHIMPAGTF